MVESEANLRKMLTAAARDSEECAYDSLYMAILACDAIDPNTIATGVCTVSTHLKDYRRNIKEAICLKTLARSSRSEQGA